MNDIKQLEERIAQLTELVKTGSEAIKNMETALKAAEEERDRLADQRREPEPKFEKVEIGESYFYVFLNDYGAFIVKETESNELLDRELYKTNNYFKTKERAQEVADKINFLLRLERLHDTFCPDYVPDWNSDVAKYAIYYGHERARNRYEVQVYGYMRYPTNVYFPTEEIAQKVCDILNKELEEKVTNHEHFNKTRSHHGADCSISQSRRRD